jgi:hypothetical protein
MTDSAALRLEVKNEYRMTTYKMSQLWHSRQANLGRHIELILIDIVRSHPFDRESFTATKMTRNVFRWWVGSSLLRLEEDIYCKSPPSLRAKVQVSHFRFDLLLSRFTFMHTTLCLRHLGSRLPSQQVIAQDSDSLSCAFMDRCPR